MENRKDMALTSTALCDDVTHGYTVQLYRMPQDLPNDETFAVQVNYTL